MATAAVYSHTEHYSYRTLFMYYEREGSDMSYLVNSIDKQYRHHASN